MHRRVNVTLPERTLRLIDRVAKRGDRSGLIAAAVESYVEQLGRDRVRKLLKEGGLRRAERDRQIASMWAEVEDGAWPGGTP